jgi:N utilization substance protein B
LDKKISSGTLKKSSARLAAVQAVYSSDMDDDKKNSATLTLDLLSYYSEQADSSDEIISLDEKFLNRLIDLTLKNIEDLDQIISEFLLDNWSLDKLSSVIKSILRCGVCEIKFMPDVPAKVVIDEYTSLARAFYGNKEIGFVNSILDKIAGKIRPKEFK